MFSGIIEALGRVEKIEIDQTNFHFTISAPFTHELQIDQSVAHNGVCLTVVAIHDNQYTVTAIAETMEKTHLHSWKTGTIVNLERCVQVGDRIDGHMVQGHVDTTAICKEIIDHQGSWEFVFEYQPNENHITVAKGSITVNGVSLTVVQSQPQLFSVAIIPYTYEHTNFHTFKKGSVVNLEFDVLGKYIQKLYEQRL